MARTLDNLLTFVRSHDTEDSMPAIRLVLVAMAPTLARELGVTLATLRQWIESETDDQTMVSRLYPIIRKGQKIDRARQRDSALSDTGKAVSEVASRATWNHGRLELDAPALLRGKLPPAGGYLVVSSPLWEVWIDAGRLRKFARLPQAKRARAWVDGKGFHLRWGTGGLDLIPQPSDRNAPVAVMSVGKPAEIRVTPTEPTTVVDLALVRAFRSKHPEERLSRPIARSIL